MSRLSPVLLSRLNTMEVRQGAGTVVDDRSSIAERSVCCLSSCISGRNLLTHFKPAIGTPETPVFLFNRFRKSPVTNDDAD